MGSEITLPWTCDTSDRVKNGIKWMILLTAPLFLIHVIYLMYTNTHGSTLNIIEFIYGVFGTVLGWAFRLLFWHIDDKLPHFRCKEKKN